MKRGDTLALSATWEVSRDDKSFAFGKRPTVVSPGSDCVRYGPGSQALFCTQVQEGSMEVKASLKERVQALKSGELMAMMMVLKTLRPETQRAVQAEWQRRSKEGFNES